MLEIEVWLRGNDHAITDGVDVDLGDPAGWTDVEVQRLLEELLRAIDRAKHADADPDRSVTLRGFSWIVTPFEDAGVLVSVEIQLGAAAAGPFRTDQARLEAAITRLVAAARLDTGAPPPRVH